MKKITAIIIVLVFTLSLVSCSGGETASNRLEKPVSEISKALSEKLDLSDLDCLTNADDNAENLLLFIYGVSESELENIDSYFITNSHRSTDARAIAVIIFKDNDKVSDSISNVQANIRDIFLKNLVNTTATYDAEQAKIAGAASFKLYDNALVFASYDTEGNAQVFDAIK